ncbi:MAG: ABC transporter ATP-binding protein [Erysipelotrichaceae bacterium]|nr:ABC transporter ATP-binding protein [Erysipelotrichaceae bacterium]
MLEIKGLSVHYGMIHAVKDLSMQVNAGEIVALIGANGAGKSTLLKTISGLLPKTSGSITTLEQDITHSSPVKIVGLGVIHVPEGRRVFSGLSVLENLQMGAYSKKDKSAIKESLAEVFAHFPILQERLSQDAATLSGGEQQMLAIGRALMAKPKLLLLDEPSMGLAPILVKEIFSIITSIHESGTTVLLVEQNARMALSIADRGYVMETGRLVLQGTGKELAESAQVQKVYLGG